MSESDSLLSELQNTTERFVNNTLAENDVLTDENVSTVTDENIQATQASSKPLTPSQIGLICGIVGGIVLLVIVIVTVCVIRKKRQQGGKYNPKDCENKAGVMQHQFDHPSMSPPSPERLI